MPAGSESFDAYLAGVAHGPFQVEARAASVWRRFGGAAMVLHMPCQWCRIGGADAVALLCMALRTSGALLQVVLPRCCVGRPWREVVESVYVELHIVLLGRRGERANLITSDVSSIR